MKIFEIIQERKPDHYKSGADRLRDVQRYQQSVSGSLGKLSGDQIARAVGKYNIGGLDAEEIFQQDISQLARKDREKAVGDIEDKVQKARDEKDEYEKRQEIKQRKADDKKRRDQIRRDAQDRKRKERVSKRADDKYDKDMGFRKDAAGRTLRAPRYYKDGKTAKGKIVGGDGTIARGINRFVSDPGRTIADYYNARISSIKDFINTRIE